MSNLEKLYLTIKKLSLKIEDGNDYFNNAHEAGIPIKNLKKLKNNLFGLEANFEELSAIDFKKGCYIGQENTSRIKLKNKLNKRLFFDEYVRLNTYFYGTPYANPNNPMLDFNPQKALTLLNEAGWVRKDGQQWLTNSEGQIFEFEFLIAPGGDRIYTTFQEDLKNVILSLIN